MELTKIIINQYASEKKEVEELIEKIEILEKTIKKLQERISEIEEGHTVKDKVRGGEGGNQSFVVEGVPYDEWNDKKAKLEFKMKALQQRKELLETEELNLLLTTKEVEKFISNIKDSVVRRIIRHRILDGLSWNDVATKIGGGNTEGSVKMIYQRYLEKNI